ncbi:hypothetical protein JJD41_19000 [Oxynema sp. CENA135]|jgi:hypothetical protein|uniref:TRAFAC clade GTPase domain-containing protein n=1 Tax=Oxynema sp. CENA135 TaxID=984206 RepID=UPI00190D937F|nr:hypothetical protein [Oxynema sp. CENA135]MBK4731942.1 hypothetical protein [Oxynema sp. CENA135]
MNFFWKSSKLPVLNVTMLGPSGVGKTSLLAAMYDQFDKVSYDLQLKADDGTKSVLDYRLDELKSLAGDSIVIRDENKVEPTKEDGAFNFEFGETGTYAALEIKFQDYPGEDLTNPKTIEKVKNFVRESAAVLIPIDTPALMEQDGKYHEYINKPDVLSELFKTVYQNLDSPRLVILAPVKCEKYMENPSELFKTVREKYSQILGKLGSEKLLPKIAVVITPVQTVGSVIFSRIEENENQEPVFHYRKRQPNDPYQPRDTEKPLKYLLRFLLKLYFENRKASIFARIFDFFGKNASLRNAVQCFSKPGSEEIVQGSVFFKL